MDIGLSHLIKKKRDWSDAHNTCCWNLLSQEATVFAYIMQSNRQSHSSTQRISNSGCANFSCIMLRIPHPATFFLINKLVHLGVRTKRWGEYLEATGCWRRLHKEIHGIRTQKTSLDFGGLHNLYISTNIVRVIKVRGIRRVGHVTRKREMINANKILVRKC
jgi:hypothetical protein